MGQRDDLLESIAKKIKNYRKGEIPQPTPTHVDRWISQFKPEVQVPLLKELKHVLKQTYFKKSDFSIFFYNLISNEKLAGNNYCDFWRKANLLDIQQNGNSQTEILSLFSESLKEQCKIDVKDCGSTDGAYIYMDDILFSGNRISTDLNNWISYSAPSDAQVHIIAIGTHLLGEWQCLQNLKKTAQIAGKNISFSCWASVRLENRKKYKNRSEVFWPAQLPNHAGLVSYMAKETKFPFVPRTPSGSYEDNVFSSEEGRQLLESELLLAGVKILEGCENPKRSLRPLGFGFFGLGFGATIMTYRNCPNNCPLALWWGDPDATSGPFHWYPLLPRKTYSDFSNLIKQFLLDE